jgi:DNA-binding response OmpR family regulator
MADLLVVDDEKNIVELVSFLLEKEGHKVKTALDGQACLNLLAGYRPDLIVLDVMLPIMDGYTVCTKLAAEEATRNIPILILTAKGQMRDVFALATNVAGYMEKPFEPSSLVAKVNEILASRPAK